MKYPTQFSRLGDNTQDKDANPTLRDRYTATQILIIMVVRISSQIKKTYGVTAIGFSFRRTVIAMFLNR